MAVIDTQTGVTAVRCKDEYTTNHDITSNADVGYTEYKQLEKGLSGGIAVVGGHT